MKLAKPEACDAQGCTQYSIQTVETNVGWINQYFAERIEKADPIAFSAAPNQKVDLSEGSAAGLSQSTTAVRYISQWGHMAAFALESYSYSAGAAHGTIYFKMLDDAAFYAANSMVSEHFVLTTQFNLLRYEKELERLEQWCNTHLNTMFQLLTHEKGNVTQKFFEEVAVQVRRAFEHANRDVEIWLKAVMAPMETQVREHQIQLKRRLESIKRIHQATDTLEDRIGELNHMEAALLAQIDTLQTLGNDLQALLHPQGEGLQAAA